MCSAQNRRRKMWSDYRNREKNEKRSSAWWGKRRKARRGLDFVGKMSVLAYGSGSWWCLSCYMDTVWTSSLLAEVSHGKREIKGKSETSAGLQVFFRVAADHICLWNLLVFKTGFCLMWNALFLLRLQRLEISEPTVVIAQTGSVSYVARD